MGHLAYYLRSEYGLLLVAALPPVVAVYLLHALQPSEDDASETLLRELVERPELLTSGEKAQIEKTEIPAGSKSTETIIEKKKAEG